MVLDKKRKLDQEESNDGTRHKKKTDSEKFINYYECPDVKKHNTELVNPHYDVTGIKPCSRWLWVGGSGTGKTNGIMNFITRMPDVYDGIIVVNAGVQEPLYKALEEKLEGNGNLVFFTLDTFPSFAEFEHAKPAKHHYLLILDDLMGELSGSKKKMLKIQDYFTRGRKITLDIIFLSQSYFRVDPSIRQQLTYLSLLKLNSMSDLNRIMADYQLGVTKTQLVDMYRKATENPLNSLRIDIGATNPDEKFYRNFVDGFNVDVRVNPADGMEYSVVTPGAWYKPPARDVSEMGKKRKRDFTSLQDTFFPKRVQ